MKYVPNAYFNVGLLIPEVAHSLLLNKVKICFLVFLVTSYLLLSSSYLTETARMSFYGTHSIGIQNPYGLFPGIPWNSLEFVITARAAVQFAAAGTSASSSNQA